MSTDIKLVGNLTADPEIKFGQNGKAWARFTVVTNARVLNKETNKWEDRDPTFWDCVAFDKIAENLAESAAKGTRVIVLGTVKQESYDTREGEKRTVMRVNAQEIGVSLKFGPTKAGTPLARPQAQPTGGGDPWGAPPF